MVVVGTTLITHRSGVLLFPQPIRYGQGLAASVESLSDRARQFVILTESWLSWNSKGRSNVSGSWVAVESLIPPFEILSIPRQPCVVPRRNFLETSTMLLS